jgi:hypothetical protein
MCSSIKERSMKEQAEIEKNQQDYPGVEMAYPLALGAYEVMQKRMDAVENRLQTLIGFATTLSLAIIAAVSGKGFNFHSRLFYAAIALYAAGIAVGYYARLWGSLLLFDPSKAFRESLRWSEWEFKKNAIDLAGKAFTANRRVINYKGWLTAVAATLFLFEAVCLAVWLARS